MPEGRYEFALLSDDGSLLELDTDGDKQFELIVDNDGLHSTRLGCSSIAVNLKHKQLLPLQLKYYQGPRTHIALTLLARKLADNEMPGQDAYCGHASSKDYYGADPAESNNYVPNYDKSYFGDLTRRGWFVPQNEMFLLKK